MIDYNDIISKLRSNMINKNIDCIFLDPSGNMEYFTGIKRNLPNNTTTHLPGGWLYGVFITNEDVVYVIPEMISGFIDVTGKEFITDVVVLEEKNNFKKLAKDIITKLLPQNGVLAVPKTTSSETVIKVQKIFPHLNIISSENITRKMRMIKTEQEVNIMKKAAEITDNIFMKIVKQLKIGMTEIEVAQEIEYQMLRNEAEGTSFDTAVMVRGKGKPAHIGGISFTKLEPGCTLAFDFGLIYKGYCSDFGRTVYIGEPTNEMEKIHKLVMNAQKKAIDSMIPQKITAEEVDRVARNIISDAGYGDYFIHRLGHGIGKDVHEYPFLNTGYDNLLQENMTFTVEPSIFIADKLLIRVEDVVLVNKNGGESLNKATKEILVID